MTFSTSIKSALFRDLVTTVLATFVIFLVLQHFDAFEELYEWTRTHEDWELDEWVLIVAALPLPITWFAYRRVRQAMDETDRRIDVERALAHSRKLRSIGTLAGGVAHEINNQLVPVMTMSELLLNRMPESDPDRRKMELIMDGAARAKKTVENVLDFSRVRRDPSPGCEVTRAIRESEPMLTLGGTSNARVILEVAEHIGVIELSADDLQGVVLNLFSNAIDALAGKPGEVVLTAERMELGGGEVANLAAGDYARITVRDTGSGINQEDLNHIFDPFFSSKPPGEGVGLGLSIVHTLVTDAGGTVTASSELGNGSTLSVYLPTTDGAEAQKHPHQADR